MTILLVEILYPYTHIVFLLLGALIGPYSNTLMVLGIHIHSSCMATFLNLGYATILFEVSGFYLMFLLLMTNLIGYHGFDLCPIGNFKDLFNNEIGAIEKKKHAKEKGKVAVFWKGFISLNVKCYLVQAICSTFTGSEASIYSWVRKECTSFTGKY